MIFDEAALQSLSECISRGEQPMIDTTDGEGEVVWCERCEAQIAVRVPLRGFTDKGTYEFGKVTVCPVHEVFN